MAGPTGPTGPTGATLSPEVSDFAKGLGIDMSGFAPASKRILIIS